MSILHKLNVLPTEDDRNKISNLPVGVYYVHKKQLLTAFPFGVAGHSQTAEDAHKSLTIWLSSRKDSGMLRVTLIEREE